MIRMKTMSASNERWYVPDWSVPSRVHCLLTTRRGGVSRPPYQGLNLSTHVGDDADAVAANRRSLAAALPGVPCWLDQVHGTTVIEVTSARGAVPPVADAAFSRECGQVCVVMTADCLPVLFCDRAATVVAIAHAGWRGLQAGVLEATMAAMQVAAADVQAYFGPAIGPSAFEVGDEVRDVFLATNSALAAAFTARISGDGRNKWLANLYLLARLRLQALGVGAIDGGNACTFSDQARYFSFRRDGVTGRMASLIWLA